MGNGNLIVPIERIENIEENIDELNTNYNRINSDMTTRKTTHDQFASVMEYVNYLPAGTETFFITWDSKTDFPVKSQGYWECKIYKAVKDTAYTRIELSLFVRNVGHYKWLGSVQSDSTIVWSEISANNNFITDIGRFRVMVVEDTMPTTVTENRISINHTSGKLFLLSANVLHVTNGYWYMLSDNPTDDACCVFGSGQYRLKICNQNGLTAFGGAKVRLLFGCFE